MFKDISDKMPFFFFEHNVFTTTSNPY